MLVQRLCTSIAVALSSMPMPCRPLTKLHGMLSLCSFIHQLVSRTKALRSEPPLAIRHQSKSLRLHQLQRVWWKAKSRSSSDFMFNFENCAAPVHFPPCMAAKKLVMTRPAECAKNKVFQKTSDYQGMRRLGRLALHRFAQRSGLGADTAADRLLS